ncbi:DUF3106 domain-containing protein [Telluria beijingensis]|uniref:DUF3106 domain-containing protein n=1 Tax=Telluria beijingensis TaxID=3068633 RepID=UPI0027960AB0|nr:DUF3106 domain-containing protein [Massilia sp. REN29]
MTKNDASQSRATKKPGASKSRFPVLGTVAGVLAAGAIAWVIVDRFDTPSVLPSTADAVNGASVLPKKFDKPLWDDLSSAQQVALAPLEPEWNRMEGPRKRKWIEMSARFASMPASEQQRVHERMRQWMKLTPAQRELARENYSRTSRLAQGDKAADWENYKQLSADQKRKLANSPAATRHKSIPVALPEAPMLVTPTPCPPNTTRRGAECILAGTDTALPSATASVPPAGTPPAAGPATPAVTPGPASASPGVDTGSGAIAAPGGQQAPAQAANASN